MRRFLSMASKSMISDKCCRRFGAVSRPRVRRSELAAVVVLVGALAVASGTSANAAEEVPPASAPGLPGFGLPGLPVSGFAPDTPAQVSLGKKLFFDKRLSPSGTVSCAKCHLPDQGFTQTDRARATGLSGKLLRRNAPTLLNVAFMEEFFHDGRSPTLEAQALAPFTDREEFGAPSIAWVSARVSSLADYHGLFLSAFGRGPDEESLGGALAAYQRTLIAADSPFDRWFYGKDDDAMPEDAKRGFALFRGKAECAACHRIGEKQALFHDFRFHDTGISWRNAQGKEDDARDTGREEATGRVWDRFKIKTPTLRNIALTAPYMHDGSIATLEEAVRFYADGGVDHATLSPLIGPIDLSDAEVSDLVAFLENLTSPHAETVGR